VVVVAVAAAAAEVVVVLMMIMMMDKLFKRDIHFQLHGSREWPAEQMSVF
jgi:hypothetical protein